MFSHPLLRLHEHSATLRPMTSAHKKKVLIVEDDNLLLITLTHQFEDAGYVVATATDGAKGVEQFTSEEPDAVIMDVMMPVKDGVEMLGEIRTAFPQSKVPFIVLSNANDMDYVSRAMELGAVAYLLKSDRQIDSVVALVEEHISKV